MTERLEQETEPSEGDLGTARECSE